MIISHRRYVYKLQIYAFKHVKGFDMKVGGGGWGEGEEAGENPFRSYETFSLEYGILYAYLTIV